MTIFKSPVPLPPFPQDLTIPQFMLREFPDYRPVRPRNAPLFIEDRTGRPVSFDEVHYRTHALANALSIKWNISRNDVVCLFSPNDTDYAVTVWAVHTLGAIVTPANPSYTAEELQYQLEVAKAKLLVVHPACLSVARTAARLHGLPQSAIIVIGTTDNKTSPTIQQLVEFGADQPESYEALRFKPGESRTHLAFLSFSSGTTGKPKAVAIPHLSVIANIFQMAAHFHIFDPDWPDKRIIPGDVILGVLPFFHIYGLIVALHYTVYCGSTIVVVPKFNFVEFLDSIERYRVTHLYIVPPQIVLLCKHPAAKGRDFSSVKFVMSGAAPLSSDLMNQTTRLFRNAVIGQGYGLTETCTTVSQIQPERRFGTIGGAGGLMPGILAKVVKPDGTLAKEGEQGELVLTGPSMSLEYYGNPKATAETYVDGWIRTGDEVIIKDDELFIIDRLKEILKVRGFQVAPAELEGHLLLHPYVADSCVVGIPDEYSGELPLAFVVPDEVAKREIAKGKDGAMRIKRAIEKHVSDHKVPYKRLTGGIEFVDAIPKNPSGKILRRFLRDKAKEMAATRHLQPKL